MIQELLRAVSNIGSGSQRLQCSRSFIFLPVAAADTITRLQEHLGNGREAGAADANEMYSVVSALAGRE